MPATRSTIWRYARGLAAPLLLWCLVVVALRAPVQSWLQGHEKYDEEAVREWVKEARVSSDTLPELAGDYLAKTSAYLNVAQQIDAVEDKAGQAELRKALQEAELLILLKRGEIQEHLRSLGDPPTKMYTGQLPLFPTIYRLEMRFDVDPRLPSELREPIDWDSQLPRRPGQYRELNAYSIHPHAALTVQYQLHAYNKQQQNEQVAAQRLRWLGALAAVTTGLAFLWIYLVQHRERERDRQRVLAQQQVDQAERLLLQEELRRQEAERLHEDTERKLLEQRLATQAAERQALELNSQLYASIGIMAGSYAHNIKNLLVRPNDLLRRCLEADGLSRDQEQMLHEVRQTLGTVTERLQQILRTVRRDPTQAELNRLDLNVVVGDLHHTWKDLAREKWKLELTFEPAPEPLWVEGDLSHLQQAVENLLFNARDATFEMRGQLRGQAHHSHSAERSVRSTEREEESTSLRQALIAAAGWKGAVRMKLLRDGDRAILEVRDNGIGMTEEVRRRCTETHFSTKRHNAIYEGNSTGMGLGLSFVVATLEHHQATLAIDTEPLHGTTFRVSFPLARQHRA